MVTLQGNEVTFDTDDIIVSKTDLKGRMTYVNKTFMDVAGYSEEELLGQPHNLIRHPAMPRCVFKLLWDTLGQGQEIFAYVVNQTKNGDYYWVLAHVTPSFDRNGNIIGYHSSRRVPDKTVVSDVILPLYQDLLKIEESVPNAKEGMNKAFDTLVAILTDKGVSYGELVASLMNAKEDAA